MAVSTIEKKLDFVVKFVDVSYSVNANSSVSVNPWNAIINNAPQGYTPVGFVGYTTNTANAIPYALRCENNTYAVQIKNISNSNITQNIRLFVLYKSN